MSSDYSGASIRRNVIFAFSKSEDIAESMADYLTNNICQVVTNCSQNLQLHGHSWGAHTCGIAGYKLGQRGFKPYRLIGKCPRAIYHWMYEFHKFQILGHWETYYYRCDSMALNLATFRKCKERDFWFQIEKQTNITSE